MDRDHPDGREADAWAPPSRDARQPRSYVPSNGHDPYAHNGSPYGAQRQNGQDGDASGGMAQAHPVVARPQDWDRRRSIADWASNSAAAKSAPRPVRSPLGWELYGYVVLAFGLGVLAARVMMH